MQNRTILADVSAPGQPSPQDAEILQYLTEWAPMAVPAFRQLGQFIEISHSITRVVSTPDVPPTTVEFVRVWIVNFSDGSRKFQARSFLSGPLVSRRVAMLEIVDLAKRQLALVTVENWITLIQALAPLTLAGTLVVRNTHVQVPSAIGAIVIFTEGPTSSNFTIGLSDREMIHASDHIHIQLPSIRYMRYGPSPLDDRVPNEHHEVFVDLARQGKEAEFKDLAQMILDRLSPDDIDAMWTGTVRRLRRKPLQTDPSP